MKFFSERNPVVIGVVGCVVFAGLAVGAMQYDKLPGFVDDRTYSAYFTEAGGIHAGDVVQVSGVRVGQVSAVELDGNRVLVSFGVDKDLRLGDRTEAAIKVKTLLGAKILEVTPRGDGRLRDTIPVERTRSPYELPDALGDLSETISGLDTGALSQSLDTLAQTFQDTPEPLREAVDGVARFSDTLNQRDAQLRSLLANARKATAVLAERSDQVVQLIAATNALLVELRGQGQALDSISGNISAISQQLSAVVAENRTQLRPALDKLNGVLTILDNRKERIQTSIKLLNAYAMSLGESVAAGPFFKVYLANMLPGQFLQPFIDAAFSDLGLDPNVLPPSQLADPQTGQPATPALPVPYPRTGQGGEPHLTLPDAITGNPGDPRYPYRPPLPAPPAGGPPPGPPAPDPAFASPPPTPSPVFVPAPDEVPAGPSTSPPTSAAHPPEGP
jgi:phospholipid/cholesterol/gamma-HCH transport system substrate-binding protein